MSIFITMLWHKMCVGAHCIFIPSQPQLNSPWKYSFLLLLFVSFSYFVYATTWIPLCDAISYSGRKKLRFLIQISHSTLLLFSIIVGVPLLSVSSSVNYTNTNSIQVWNLTLFIFFFLCVCVFGESFHQKTSKYMYALCRFNENYAKTVLIKNYKNCCLFCFNFSFLF